jgi:phosphatidate cytidylyltransferase
MLKLRIIFGTLFSALFAGLIFLDSYASRLWPDGSRFTTPPGFFVALASLVIIPMALREMRDLLAHENVRISMRITVVAAILCMLWPWVEQIAEASPWHSVETWFRTVKPHYLVPTILTVSLVAAFVMHSRDGRVKGAMANAGGTLLAIVYLGVLPGFFLPICLSHSAWMMLAICGIVKSADIGAYAIGRLIGRRKLIPWLSPGKTVEGFIGGLALAGIVGALVALMFHLRDGPRWQAMSPSAVLVGGSLAGIILGAVGQLGDLLESLLKRDAGVKDSGAVPGFGGVLDILDSPLLAAPVAYWMLKMVVPPTSYALGSP